MNPLAIPRAAAPRPPIPAIMTAPPHEPPLPMSKDSLESHAQGTRESRP